jgi:hypothetical protein
MRRGVGLAIAGAALLLGAVLWACSDTFPRDQHYGTDAGQDFNPPRFDAAASDGPVGDAVDAGED